LVFSRPPVARDLTSCSMSVPPRPARAERSLRAAPTAGRRHDHGHLSPPICSMVAHIDKRVSEMAEPALSHALPVPLAPDRYGAHPDADVTNAFRTPAEVAL